MFWYTTLHNLKHRVLPFPERWREGLDAVLVLHWFGPLLWYLVVAGMVLVRFWFLLADPALEVVVKGGPSPPRRPW